MKFFGQSVHGEMDLNDDGLIDVTIGGLGGAALFWYGDSQQLTGQENFCLNSSVTCMHDCLDFVKLWFHLMF